MSTLDGVVPMELDDRTGCEGLSTPLRDPTSSPAVHIQWQNSQSACAALEELRVASSIPRRRKFDSESFASSPIYNPDAVFSIYSTSAPKPLTFGFELPASALPSSHASDPFFSSRTRLRSARSRNIERVQSRSQNDVFASPVADASKFLDMLGRASARVDENSRKRMKVLCERPKRSSVKGKERLCATTRGTRSMDELGDHTNFIMGAAPETRVHHSSLPIVLGLRIKDPAEHRSNDVHVRADTAAAISPAPTPAPGNDGIKPPVSTRPQNGTQHFPPCASASATHGTRHSQKRIELPSPSPIRSSAPARTPLRPVPAPVPSPVPVLAHKPKSSRTFESGSAPSKSTPSPIPHLSDIHAQREHPVPVPTPLPPTANDALSKGAAAASAVLMTDSLARHGKPTSTSTSVAAAAATSASTSLISAHLPPSQTHGPKRALGMTRNVPRSFSSSSSNTTPHSAAVKKPFHPPLTRPATQAPPATISTTATKPQQIPPTSSRSHSRDSQRQQRRQEDGSKKGSGADPDSSFDISFDFDPEALEAAMRQYD